MHSPLSSFSGKTLCLLCAALAWQREQSRILQTQQQPVASSQTANGGSDQQQAQPYKPRVPTIIYASRTHSQLSQVVRELRNTRYRPLHAVLGSREQMCVNPKVKKATSTSADINHDCNKLGKERKCKFRNNLEGFVAPANEKGGTGNDCQPVMDMEDLVKMGNEHKVCPFYYTRSQVENAELILVPYNYLFDKDAKESTLQGIDWKNSVVIFDEAHNLESFASESASFDLSNTDIAGCIMDVNKTINYIDSGQESIQNLKRENMLRLKMIFLKLEDTIANFNNQGAYAGEFMMEIFRQGYITHANHEILIDELRKVNDFLMDMRGSSRGSASFDHFVHCLKRVFSHPNESRCLAKAAFYRVHVTPKPTGNQRSGRTVSYWCFAPSLAMEELTAKSIIVTSGTLAPLKGLSMELGLKFPHTLENPHIITEKQIHVRVIGKGVSGKALSSSYERRQNGDYFAELGNTLVSLAKIIPAGMLIFFPSYSVMDECIERWGGPSSNRNAAGGDKGAKFFAPRNRQQPGKKYVFICTPTIYVDPNVTRTPWKRLTCTKSVVIEPRSSADLPDAISEFQRLLALPKSRGCILMGVCRGKISEGIDFANEQSRAVVITGLPFPPTHDPKIKMKKEYLDASRTQHSMKPSGEAGFKGQAHLSSNDILSGHEWYTQQAHRAVNQAIGRVIRNRTDYGAVILLDERFGQNQNKEGLSMWLRPHIKNDEGFGVAVRGLVSFYKEADAQTKEMAKKDAEAEAKSVVLEYEEEDDDVLFTKVAIVRRPANETVDGEDTLVSVQEEAQARDYVAPGDIISRVDVRDAKRTETIYQQLPEPGPSSNPTTGSGKFDAVFQQKSTAAPSHTNAAQFFAMAKRLLSHDELATMKKAVVAIKTHNEKNDLQSYVQTARQIVELINKHDHLELNTGPGESRMLLIFFKLQSKPRKKQIEDVAMRMVFDSSSLGRLCCELLPETRQSIVRIDMVALLQHLWCESDVDGTMKRQKLVDKSKQVLQVLLNLDKAASSSLVGAYMKLVPSDRVAEARALVDQLTATLNVDKLKAADKARFGETSVNSDRFKMASGPLIKVERANVTAGNAPQPADAALPATKRPLEVAGAIRNPYAKKKLPSTTVVSTERCILSSQPTLLHQNRVGSLSSVLQKVEQSGPYLPSGGDQFAKAAESLQMQANGAMNKNLTCPICTTIGLKEPFIAECGHIACLGCWKSWFKRSPSCPTCRKPASKESIARVVFERPPNVDDKCLGGTYPQDRADNSSEDELEITY
ncbi:hypothetical protein MPSEU_000951500 [Mayamaea pseudoterrestris]|nr:hypothetical protein MPSEU_000951500 [Mayamaea pseudoterrestris]